MEKLLGYGVIWNFCFFLFLLYVCAIKILVKKEEIKVKKWSEKQIGRILNSKYFIKEKEE